MPITDVQVRHGIKTGVSYGVQMQGVVPEYEELEAMEARGLTEAAWLALGWWERARIIAARRLGKFIALHTQEAIVEAQKRKAD